MRIVGHRRARRHEVDTPHGVVVDLDEASLFGFVLDVSRSGARVQLKRDVSPPRGTRVGVTFHGVPGTWTGEVRWHRAGERGTELGLHIPGLDSRDLLEELEESEPRKSTLDTILSQFATVVGPDEAQRIVRSASARLGIRPDTRSVGQLLLVLHELKGSDSPVRDLAAAEMARLQSRLVSEQRGLTPTGDPGR